MARSSRTAQRAKADRLFGKIIRSRARCEASWFRPPYCGGVFQTAHIVPRKYLSVRWEYDNAFCLCAAHHVYFTHFPLAWERFRDQKMGDAYFALRKRAESAAGPPDYDTILTRLEADAKALA